MTSRKNSDHDLAFLAEVRALSPETFPAFARRYRNKRTPEWKQIAVLRQGAKLGLTDAVTGYGKILRRKVTTMYARGSELWKIKVAVASLTRLRRDRGNAPEF